MTTHRTWLLWVLLATIVVAGPIGCSKKEIDELKTRVASLEKELADTQAKLADADSASGDSRTKVEQWQTKEDVLAAEVTRVRVERDRCKQELSSLKKRR